jgi:hypothetical protein
MTIEGNRRRVWGDHYEPYLRKPRTRLRSFGRRLVGVQTEAETLDFIATLFLSDPDWRRLNRRGRFEDTT